MKSAAVILGYLKKTNEPILVNAIQALQHQTYRDFDVFVYDNSTEENPLAEVKSKFPEVKVKHNRKNIGFAGGNNSVMRETIQEGYKYIVLLNDDTEVEPKWLEKLVTRAESNEQIGAVSSKLLFFEPYLRFEFTLDSKGQGIKFYEASSFGDSNYSKKFFREGFLGIEDLGDGKFSRTKSSFIIDLPAGKETGEHNLNLIVDSETNQELEIKLGDFITRLTVKEGNNTYEIEIPTNDVEQNKFNLIQNAGSGITAQFNGYDIGNTQRAGTISSDAEIDKGQYDSVKELEMFCGGAVLLKAKALSEAGIFDEYFFVYYEDSDLSLRLRRKGWKIIYEPEAVVRHMHATSSGEWSPFFVYHLRKNKPAFVIKNFGIRPSIYAVKEIYVITFKSIARLLRSRLKDQFLKQNAMINLKAFFKFNLNLPIILLKKFNILQSR